MSFSKKFYAATREYNTLEKHLNAPYMRRTFNVGDDLNEARLAEAFDK